VLGDALIEMVALDKLETVLLVFACCELEVRLSRHALAFRVPGRSPLPALASAAIDPSHSYAASSGELRPERGANR
jgi:hypothetical protein